MRLIIDMQGAQTASRLRGIGRFTRELVLEMARQAQGRHEIILALNGAYPDTIEPIRSDFSGLIPQENIRVWSQLGPTDVLSPDNLARGKAAEIQREAFLNSLQPDVLFIPSLFEEFGGQAVTSIGLLEDAAPVVTVLHDLIPLIYKEKYLVDPIMSAWYYQKLDHVRRADWLLSISESSAREAVEYLDYPQERISIVSEGFNKIFHRRLILDQEKVQLKQRFDISKYFILYIGGNDWRKNVEGLIRAYGLLPEVLRKTYRLVLAGHELAVQPEYYRQLAKASGLSEDNLVLTGYVSDEDLVLLYNACTLFIFPSWHEGFGLPALEAMACGKAVIAANASSLPEVIGHPEALFAARDDVAMRDKMTQVLEDVTLRQRLEQHGLEQAQKFSWQKGAAQAWQALEKLHAEHKAMKHTRPRRGQRPKLAFVSPLPDARSGIADYAAELLPELARHYDITAIIAQKEPVTDPWILANVPIRDVAWFEQHAARFDRLLYQFGNSPYHSPMFDLLQKYPGVIVLHDYFLSGLICHRDGIGETSGEFPRQLQHGHGFPALQWRHAHPNDWGEDGAISRYSCNLTVLQNALNVIVHSQHTKRLAEVDYGADAVREWFVIPDFCHTLSELDRYTRAEAGGSSGNAQAHACKQIRPRTCADAYAEAIEATYQKAESGGFGALRRIAAHEPGLFGSDVPGLARAYADNFPPTPRMPQLLLDISELVQRDAKTGIQRVTRALLSEIVQNPPSGWQIEAVYATTDQPGYRYARKFLSRVLEIPDDWANDEPVQVWPGDLFFGMDFQREVIAAQIPLLRDWRNRGVPCYFVVHDLLPVTMPEVFPEGSRDGHQAWLSAITQLDGALCVSRHVADELYDWLQHFGAERRRPYTIGWFHHGSDLESSAPTRGMPQDASTVLSLLQARPTFLMVGTIEPRKGYLQTLQAFDLLWADGVDVNLVIVGKEGWTPLPDSARRDIPETVRYLRAHPELGKRLHLLAGISDEYLEAVYATSNCLIAASYDEGFGLPIIEAAHHGLPLLVRDIPVFHEVTADQAFFFADSRQPEVIATAVKEWLNLYQQNAHPRSDALPHQNWSDSARQVLDALLGIKAPYRTWLPDGVIRYWGNDPRLHSRVGERGYGRETRTTGKAGHLIYGPYRHLEAGSYRLIISGYAEYWTGSESIAVCYNRGERQISYNKADCKKIGLWQEVIDFDIQDQLEDYEIQFYVDQSSKLSIDSIIICKKVVPNNSEEDLMAYINSRLDLVQYVEDFRSTKNSTIMLQTSDPYRYKRLLCTSQEINQKYCNKYGIQYKKFIGIRYGIYPHHAMFNRIYEIKRLVDDGYAGWVFYLDADSILYREDFDLQKKLSDLKKDGKFAWLHNVYLKDDPLYAFERINDGAFALNLESGYVRLLVDIWDKIYSDYYSYEIFSSAIKWEDIFNDNGSFNIILLSLANRFGDDFKNGIMFEQFQDCWNSDTYHEGVVFQALRFRHDGISPDDELELRRDALIKKMGSSSNHVEL